jgi:glycosyltransferase involved in cell wall biosynthesis
MKILVDYRPALRERTGVGEYIYRLVKAYTAAHDDEVGVFSSSWKDRPAPGTAQDLGARVIDRRVPVRTLNYLWHRAEWPPIESLAGPWDVVHAAHPLLIPARRAAQVVTIHDLFFLSQSDQTRAEIRRDYPALAPAHARRADAVITSTEYGRRLVIDQLGVPGDRIYVCPPGAPSFNLDAQTENRKSLDSHACVLFLGTLEPRKNIGALLDAYELLLQRHSPVPPLVLAGHATEAAAPWLARIAAPPLAGRVHHRGYVSGSERNELFASACVLVLPSLDEGFGLTALEAMSAGVPLVASNRGSLPEVVGNGGTLVDPTNIPDLAGAIERLATNDEAAAEARRAGLAQAKTFTWDRSAETLRRAYVDAVRRRRERGQ